MVHFVKRLGKVKVNDIVVIAIQKILDDVGNVLEGMSEAAATFTRFLEVFWRVSETILRQYRESMPQNCLICLHLPTICLHLCGIIGSTVSVDDSVPVDAN